MIKKILFITALLFGAVSIGAYAQFNRPAYSAIKKHAKTSTLKNVDAAAGVKKIIIYHTGDVHGAYSGYSPLKAIADKETDTVVFIDSGDWYQGTPEGNVSKGMDSIKMMNMLGYAASAIGNHEFDFGLPVLEKLASKARFPFLAANMYVGGKIPSFVKPYAVITVDGIKIGLAGFITPETKTTVMPEYIKNVDFKPIYEEIGPVTDKLKAKGVNAVIAIVHDSLAYSSFGKVFGGEIPMTDNDVEQHNLAAAHAAKGKIDVMLGGHAHNAFENGYYDKESGVLFSESGSKLAYFSRVELVFDKKTKKLLSKNAKLIALNSVKDRDAKVDALVAKFKKEADKAMKEVVGKTAGKLSTADCAYDSTFGGYITDVMRKYKNADIAFHDLSGIKVSLEKGDITKGDLFKVMPYDNTITVMFVKGEDISKLMQNNIKAFSNTMQVSGLKASFSVSANTVYDIKIEVNGAPLDPGKSYTIAASNYLAGGNGPGAAFKNGKILFSDAANMRDVIEDYIKSQGTVPPQTCGDRVFVR